MPSASVISDNPQAVRRLTESYRTLRVEATTLPFAVWFLADHAAKLMGASWRPVILVLAVVAPAAALAMHRYYDRNFGVLTRPARWGGGTWVLLLIAFVALQVTSAYLALPVQLGFLGIAIGIVIYALRHFELEGQRVLFAIIFIVLSFSAPSPFEAPAPRPPWFYSVAVCFDAIWIVVALWDHRMLKKAFEQTRLADASGAR